MEQQEKYIVFKCSCGNIALPTEDNICRFCGNVMTESLSDKSYFELLNEPIKLKEDFLIHYPSYINITKDKPTSKYYLNVLIVKNIKSEYGNLYFTFKEENVSTLNEVYCITRDPHHSHLRWLTKVSLANLNSSLDCNLVKIPLPREDSDYVARMNSIYEARYKGPISVDIMNKKFISCNITNENQMDEYKDFYFLLEILSDLGIHLFCEDNRNLLINTRNFTANPFIIRTNVKLLRDVGMYQQAQDPLVCMSNTYDKIVYENNLETIEDVFQILNNTRTMEDSDFIVPLHNNLSPDSFLNDISRTINAYFLLRRISKIKPRLKMLIEVTKNHESFKNFKLFLSYDNIFINFYKELYNCVGTMEFSSDEKIKEFIMKIYEHEIFFKKNSDCDVYVYEFNHIREENIFGDDYHNILRPDVILGLIYKEKQLKEEAVNEFIKLNETMYNGSPKLFFLSSSNMNEKVLEPRIPDNFFTKNGYEENHTPRVCFAPSIDQCLMGISQNLTNKEFFVHIPEIKQDLDIYKPNTNQVPDSKITGEIWIKNKVKIKCIGLIKVIKDKGLDGHKFTYGSGNKKYEAELYDWEWKWKNKFNESYDILNEASSPISNDKRKKIEEKIYTVMNILDKTGVNANKYKTRFSKMTNEQFYLYMKQFLKDPKQNFTLEVLPNKNEPSLRDIVKCLEYLKVPTDEYIYYKNDGHKDNPLRSRYKVPVGYIHIKRLQQILSKKNTYSMSTASRSLKTNQVSGNDKIA